MELLTDELEEKRKQREHLLLDCLPPKVAEQMRQTNTFEAG